MGPAAFGDRGSAFRMVSIHDPVAKVSYVLNPAEHTARRITAMPIERAFREEPGGSGPASIGQGAVGAPPLVRPPFERPSDWRGSRGEDTRETLTESLGSTTLEGVTAEGTRTTTTIPAGAIGNDRAIQIINERVGEASMFR